MVRGAKSAPHTERSRMRVYEAHVWHDTVGSEGGGGVKGKKEPRSCPQVGKKCAAREATLAALS